jgi:hypothetical protein
MREKPNRHGNAYGLNLFTPLLAGREEEARTAIESLPPGPDSPFARIDQLHFSRLTIFDELVYQGGGQKRESLKSRYLVYVASFDGELDPFLDAVAERMPVEADSWWGHCVGYPGASDRAGFKRYLKHNQIKTDMFAAAYPNTSVAEVREGLALRERVLAFAIGAQGIDARELHARFGQAFVEIA